MVERQIEEKFIDVRVIDRIIKKCGEVDQKYLKRRQDLARDFFFFQNLFLEEIAAEMQSNNVKNLALGMVDIICEIVRRGKYGVTPRGKIGLFEQILIDLTECPPGLDEDARLIGHRKYWESKTQEERIDFDSFSFGTKANEWCIATGFDKKRLSLLKAVEDFYSPSSQSIDELRSAWSELNFVDPWGLEDQPPFRFLFRLVMVFHNDIEKPAQKSGDLRQIEEE